MNVPKPLQEELCRSNKLSFFCGAGISRNSRIPTVYDTYLYLAQILAKDDSDALQTAQLLTTFQWPFERIMQRLIQDSGDDSFLDMYKLGLPNINHIIVAKLSAAGYVRNIVTTNFDLLFEKALEAEGLVEGVDFKVYYSEDHFEEAVGDEGLIRLIKLHGTAGNKPEHKKSIRVTLATIVQEVLSRKRQSVINYLFSDVRTDYIIFLGYSFSDIFDINPHITAVRELIKTKVIVVEHTSSVHLEKIEVKQERNPFVGTTGKGYRLQMPTEEFIKNLWKLLPGYDYETILSSSNLAIKNAPFNWHTYFDEWLSKRPVGMPAHLLSKLYDMFARYDLQLKYAEIAYGLSKETGIVEWEAEMILQVGFALVNNRKLDEAMKWYDRGVEFITVKMPGEANTKLMNVLSKFYFQQARLLEDYSSLFTEAIKLYGKTYRLDCVLNNAEGKSKTLHQFGNVLLHNRYKLPQANICNQKAKRIKEELGDLPGVAKSLFQTGNYYFVNQDYAKALENYEEVLKIADDVGELSILGMLHHNIGSVYHNMLNWEKADLHYNLAIHHKSRQAPNLTLTTSFGNKGELYYLLRYYSISLNLYLKALSIYLHFQHGNGMLSTYAMLLRIYIYSDYQVISDSKVKQYANAAFDIVNNEEGLSQRVLGDIYFALAEFEYNINENEGQARQYVEYAFPYLSKYSDYKFFGEFMEFKSKFATQAL